MIVDSLLLMSGSDIPFQKARLTVHQPTLKEISYIGEERFFIGCEILNFSKNMLSSEDKNNLIDHTDFEILMSVIEDKQNKEIQQSRISAIMVLSLLFPRYKFKYDVQNKELLFTEVEVNNGEVIGKITNDNFEDFRSILIQMFALKPPEQEYNPKGKAAQKIADKIRAGREKVAKQKAKDRQQRVSVFNLYTSILAVGLQLDVNQLVQYTVYQLYDQFNRYELKINYDIYLEAKMAGAKNLKEADNWMKDIHNDKKDKEGI